MQANDLNDLRDSISDGLLERLSGRFDGLKKKVVEQTVAEEFKKMTDQEKILSLSEDEVDLIAKFREWARSSGSASGVFHWRRKYGT